MSWALIVDVFLGDLLLGDSGLMGIVSSTIFLGLAAAGTLPVSSRREPGRRSSQPAAARFCPGSPFSKPVHGAEAQFEGKP